MIAGRIVGGDFAAPERADERFAILDTYAGGLLHDAARPDALATISAGEKVKGREGREFPQASRDGKIVLHDEAGRAVGLRAALEATEYKKLVISMPWDHPKDFLHQHYARYKATRLEVYGDAESITEVIKLAPDDPNDTRAERRVWPRGSAEYARLVATTKVQVDLFFWLARWTPEGEPAVVFPDGVGSYYRLRFTSRNSLRSIMGTLEQFARWTRGRLAGIPFDLQIDYRSVAGPDGVRRRIPYWTLAMRPPDVVEVSSRTFQGVVGGALAQGRALMLPPPRALVLDEAAAEGPSADQDEGFVVPSDRELAELAEGERADAEHWRRRWHAAVRGTPYEDDDARAEFVLWFTSGRYTSLSAFLDHALDADAEALVADVEQAIREQREERDARRDDAEAVVPTAVQDAPHERQEADEAQADEARVVEAEGETDAAADAAAVPPYDEVQRQLHTAAAARTGIEAWATQFAQDDGPANEGQLRSLKGLAKRLGLSDVQLGELARAAFGEPLLEDLTRGQARALLTWGAQPDAVRASAQALVAMGPVVAPGAGRG